MRLYKSGACVRDIVRTENTAGPCRGRYARIKSQISVGSYLFFLSSINLQLSHNDHAGSAEYIIFMRSLLQFARQVLPGEV